MRWPWHKDEKRESYTDALVAALLRQASGSTSEPRALAVIETAAGLWSRAFASAAVSPSIPALRPGLLASVGRELIRTGESVWRIDVLDGRVVLIPATSISVGGTPDPRGWRYKGTEHGPSGAYSWERPAESVLHFRYAADPARPWRGVPPWSYAADSATLAANLEQRLGQEAGSPVGSLLTVPQSPDDGAGEQSESQLLTDLAAAKGNPVLVETTAAGYGEGRGAAPQRDWSPTRFGADPPSTLSSLRDQSCRELLAACGVPPSLAVPNSDGTAQRESFRRFIAATIRPAARLVEVELSNKLDQDISLNFSDLRSDDLTGRARAFQSMVGGGIDVEKAAALSGLLLSE